MTSHGVGDLLHRRMVERGFGAQIAAAQIAAAYRAVSPQIFTPLVVQSSSPYSFRRGVLRIAVTSPAIGQEILLAQQQLKDALNAYCKAQAIQKILTVPTLEK